MKSSEYPSNADKRAYGTQEDERRLFFLATVAFGTALALGGAGADFPMLGAVVELVSLLLLYYLLLLLARGKARARWPYAVAAVILAVPALQLVPLPPELWKSLPGRDLPLEILRLTGVGTGWKSISLQPEATLTTAFELIPGLALFLAAANLQRRHVRLLALLVAGAATVSVLLGMMQSLSAGSSGNLFDSPHARFGAGLFVNRNHQATLLLMAIPLAAAALRSAPGRLQVSTALAAGLVFFLSIGVLITRSRTGLALLPLAVTAAMLISIPVRWTPRRLVGMAAALVLLGGLATQSWVVQTTMRRFADDPEQRTDYWRDSAIAIERYWPVGSGVGTFPQVYKTVESLDVVGRHEVNNAHNDYVELALETGLTGALLIAAFVAFLATACVKLWRLATKGRELALETAAATGVIIVLLHSVVDYPLRMLSVMASFGLLCGLLIRIFLRNSAERDHDRDLVTEERPQ